MLRARQGLSALGLLGGALKGEAAALGFTAAAPAAWPAALEGFGSLRGGPQSLWARLYAALPAGVTEDDKKALSDVSARPPPPPPPPAACCLLPACPSRCRFCMPLGLSLPRCETIVGSSRHSRTPPPAATCCCRQPPAPVPLPPLSMCCNPSAGAQHRHLRPHRLGQDHADGAHPVLHRAHPRHPRGALWWRCRRRRHLLLLPLLLLARVAAQRPPPCCCCCCSCCRRWRHTSSRSDGSRLCRRRHRWRPAAAPLRASLSAATRCLPASLAWAGARQGRRGRQDGQHGP